MNVERPDRNVVASLDDAIGSYELGQEHSAWGPAYAENPVARSDKEIELIQRVLTRRTSLLARPAEPEEGLVSGTALQEALEAAYVHAPVPAAEAQARRKSLERPLDTALALEGLGWLIPNLEKKSPLRRAATRARATLEPLQAVHEQAPKAKPAGSPDEQLQAAKRSREAGYRAKIDRAIAVVGEDQSLADHLRESYETVRAISDEVVIYETSEGRPAVRETPALHEKLATRVAAYLEEPSRLVIDLNLIGIIAAVEDPDIPDSDQEHDPAFVYGKALTSLIAKLTAKKTYNGAEFTPEVVAKWMDLVGELPPEAVFEVSAVADAAAESEAGTLVTADDAEAVLGEELLKLGSLLGLNILSGTLEKIARDRPRELVNAMYTVAEAGLDPAHHAKRKLTQTILEQCLSNNDRLAAYILNLSIGATEHPEIQDKALDLKLTLENLGTPAKMMAPAREQEGSPFRVASYGHRRQILRQLYPSAFAHPRITGKNVLRLQAEAETLYTSLVLGFWTFVNTPSGKSSTLYGRFLAAAEEEVIAARKAARRREA